MYHWLTPPDLMHLYSVGQTAPGTNMMMMTTIVSASRLGSIRQDHQYLRTGPAPALYMSEPNDLLTTARLNGTRIAAGAGPDRSSSSPACRG